MAKNSVGTLRLPCSQHDRAGLLLRVSLIHRIYALKQFPEGLA
jgi:hypothetical protein